MGNCVSCNERASEQVELRVKEGQRRNSELDSGVIMRNEYSTRHGIGLESMANGSRNSASNHHHLASADLTTNASTQKSDKKTFYSRIPPSLVGRSSMDKDKKMILNTSITADNNNAYSEIKISALFEYYKDPHEDAILAEGIERLCQDLELKPEDFRVLVLAFTFGAEQMCRFTREEFFRGMRSLKTDSIPGIRAVLSDISHDVQTDPIQFKDLYRFAFKFGLDSDLGQRILPVEMAVSLWRVVFWSRDIPVLERWLRFLEAHSTIRGIPRDTWNMFLNFVETVGSDLSSYDDAEAWPSLFDDFVEYENDQLNQNITNTTTTNTAENNSSVFLSKDQQLIIEIESSSRRQP